MKPLEQELNRIKNELADIGCKTMFGKTCEELVQEIITNVVKSSDLESAIHNSKYSFRNKRYGL